MEKTMDRELEAILKLIKLTQEGTLKWDAAKPWGDLVENETTRYTNVLFCDFEGKRLRIYTEKKRVDKPSTYERFASSNIFNEGKTYPYWSEHLVLEITNQSGQSLWCFPYKSAITDLLSAAKYQASGAKEMLDSLLSKPT